MEGLGDSGGVELSAPMSESYSVFNISHLKSIASTGGILSIVTLIYKRFY